MKFIYRFGLTLYHLGIHAASLLGFDKARKWVNGRKNWKENFPVIPQSTHNRYWFHCASLGEFEQGRTVIEELRKKEPSAYILLTFFSPSGYEVRKNYAVVNKVMYLPQETPTNAKRFIELLKPTHAFFIKYEYWYFYLFQLNRLKIPVFMISSIFRPGQAFFKWYGGFFRRMLGYVTFFYVQDEQSLRLLNNLGIQRIIVTGDTRFDRVFEIAENKQSIPFLEKFSDGSNVLLAGSTWSSDENILINAINNYDKENLRIIIAPHEVNQKRLNELNKSLQVIYKQNEIIYYSKQEFKPGSQVLILDTIGLLSAAYRYATVSFIGGGFGKGIHNILEAAAFGIPLLFGPNHMKFKEAQDLIRLGAAFQVDDGKSLSNILKLFIEDEEKRDASSIIAKDYVKKHQGATKKILEHIESIALQRL